MRFIYMSFSLFLNYIFFKKGKKEEFVLVQEFS